MYLGIDVETGGIGLDKSLLTAYFGIFNRDLLLVEELYLKIKSPVYHVTAKGMEVNGIDLVEHDKTAIPASNAGTLLYNFLKQYYHKNDKQFLQVLGHNVKGDIAHIKDKLISEGSWNSFVSYKVLDTGSIASFLSDMEIIPKNIDCGLNALCKFFNIPEQFKPHDAKQDVLATVEVYRKLCCFVRPFVESI